MFLRGVQSFLKPSLFRRSYRASTREMNETEGNAFGDREIIKNVYKESRITASRSEKEVQEFMQQHNITVIGDSPKPVLSIEEAPFPSNISASFKKRNFDTPTPIQSMCWPLVLSGQDMIGVAQTGSGKTLGYLLPTAMHINEQPKVKQVGPIALILAPTRELVQQIAEVSNQWLVPMRIRDAQVYGGASRLPQLNALRSGAQLCIATPGRLLDFLEGNEVSLTNSSFLILDEADRMLDMGFEPQIRDIISRMRMDRQTVMFSATWPTDVRMLAKDFMKHDATRINIGSTELCANQNVEQHITFVMTDDEKLSLLFDFLHENPNQKTLVFAATKRRVGNLAYNIIKSGIRCVESHGDLTQAKRERSLELFKGSCNVMIATDVAARGLDVQNIKCVINYDFPNTVEDYVHRIGRTGRAGNQGKSITFFVQENKALARGLILVLEQAGQTVPQKLRELAAAASGPSPSFREMHMKKPVNYRVSKGANWRNYARRG